MTTRISYVVWILIITLFVSVPRVNSFKADFVLLKDVPHDESSYTQGLVLYDGKLYESGGNYGRSSLRIVEPSTGQIISQVPLSKEYFAEGITILNDKVYMLTWRENIMFIFDAKSLKLLDKVKYAGEGWGVTDDGSCLIISDGTHIISFYEVPEYKHRGQLKKIREIQVQDPTSKRFVKNINELEYVDGYIYANIWYADIILKIDPHTGNVVRKFDFRSLYPKSTRTFQSDSFNGIAYNAADNSFIVTGKQWPKYYVVRFRDSQ